MSGIRGGTVMHPSNTYTYACVHVCTYMSSYTNVHACTHADNHSTHGIPALHTPPSPSPPPYSLAHL